MCQCEHIFNLPQRTVKTPVGPHQPQRKIDADHKLFVGGGGVGEEDAKTTAV